MHKYFCWLALLWGMGQAHAQEMDLTEKISLEFFTTERINSFQGVEVVLPAEDLEAGEYLTTAQLQAQERQRENLELAQRRQRWQENIDTTTAQVLDALEMLAQ